MATVAARQLMSPAFGRRSALRRQRSRMAAFGVSISALLAAFVVRQTEPGTTDPENLLVSVNDIQTLTGLDFFRELDDPVETTREAATLLPTDWTSAVPTRRCTSIPS